GDDLRRTRHRQRIGLEIRSPFAQWQVPAIGRHHEGRKGFVAQSRSVKPVHGSVYRGSDQHVIELSGRGQSFIQTIATVGIHQHRFRRYSQLPQDRHEQHTLCLAVSKSPLPCLCCSGRPEISTVQTNVNIADAFLHQLQGGLYPADRILLGRGDAIDLFAYIGTRLDERGLFEHWPEPAGDFLPGLEVRVFDDTPEIESRWGAVCQDGSRRIAKLVGQFLLPIGSLGRELRDIWRRTPHEVMRFGPQQPYAKCPRHAHLWQLCESERSVSQCQVAASHCCRKLEDITHLQPWNLKQGCEVA